MLIVTLKDRISNQIVTSANVTATNLATWAKKTILSNPLGMAKFINSEKLFCEGANIQVELPKNRNNNSSLSFKKI